MLRVRWGLAVLGAACLMVLAGAARAADSADTKSVDAQIYKSLALAIDRGADVYNGYTRGPKGEVVVNPGTTRNPMGCYYIYQGALLAVRDQLTHRPELQKAIDDGLRTAAANPDENRKAFDLRTVLDRIRKDTNPNPTKPETKPETPVTKKTMWDRLGGEKGVTKIVNDVIDRASDDPAVDLTRGGKFTVTPDLKKRIVELISEKTGGPLKYKGPPILPDDFKPLHIKQSQFDAFVKDTRNVLMDDGVSDSDAKVILDFIKMHKNAVEVAKPMPKALWDKLGGEQGVKKVVDDLVKRAASDPKVDFTRGGKYKLDGEEIKHLKKALVDLISSWTGGPFKYDGKNMTEAHKGMRITNEQFDAFAKDFQTALKDHGATAEETKPVMAKVDALRKDIVESNKKPNGTKPEGTKPPDTGKKPEGTKPPDAGKKPDAPKPPDTSKKPDAPKPPATQVKPLTK